MSDARTRELERRALAGDPDAERELARARERDGYATQVRVRDAARAACDAAVARLFDREKTGLTADEERLATIETAETLMRTVNRSLRPPTPRDREVERLALLVGPALFRDDPIVHAALMSIHAGQTPEQALATAVSGLATAVSGLHAARLHAEGVAMRLQVGLGSPVFRPFPASRPLTEANDPEERRLACCGRKAGWCVCDP